MRFLAASSGFNEMNGKSARSLGSIIQRRSATATEYNASGRDALRQLLYFAFILSTG